MDFISFAISVMDSNSDTAKPQAKATDNLNDNSSNRMLVPSDFFKYVGQAETQGQSMYQCMKCPCSQKLLSCYDKSRQNLKKHMMVSVYIYCFGIDILSISYCTDFCRYLFIMFELEKLNYEAKRSSLSFQRVDNAKRVSTVSVQ